MMHKSNNLNYKAIKETEGGIIHTLHNISVRKEMVCCLSNAFDIHFKIAGAAGEDRHSYISLQAQAGRPGSS